MNPDDAVTIQFHKSTADVLRLSYGWGVLDADHVTMANPQPYDFALQSSRHCIALLNCCRSDGETYVEGLPRSTVRDNRNKLIFIPAGCRLNGWAQPGAGAMAFTAAYLDPQLCSDLEEGERELYPIVRFEHPFLSQLMLRLDDILAQPETYSRMYVESFAVVMLSEISRFQAVHPSQSRCIETFNGHRGGLASWQSKAACDYIEANLHQDISLTDLAAVVRLTPYHFCRAFKQTTGVPPHHYQMTRRIKRAMTLLADASLSISDVAGIVGYGSPSRFSALFRRFTGHTPRAFRREMI
ncbi:AraC family transcriptional regulator (plasmid) [Microvirga terrae]|uniref:AraC family transcriptional regulator n=1 Tax=Microvirga terrae TaxID=2740529 RepID=A0ABY5S389_9HYPH|nr:AraC family transcriptional regulator [Microvirga terrae]UVF22689.1 AraC family transcriptional regulator [Microvirga terrae]